MSSLEPGASQDKLLYPSIPVGFVDDALQAARYRGLDVEPLLHASGLSSQRLQATGSRISIDQYSRVLNELRRQTADAFMGFLSRPVPPQAFRVFSQGMVGCRNMGDFVQQANEFYSMFSDEFQWRLERDGREILLIVEIDPALPVDYRFIIQSLLLMSVRLFGWLLGEDIELNAVSFSFKQHACDESLTYLFGPDIEYDCDVDAIRVDAGYGDAALSCTREQVKHMLNGTRHLFLVSRNKYLLSQEVRRRVLLSKTSQWLEIEDIASQLGVSKHQLWRKLKKEGTSFLEIRDQVKRDWALVLLEDPSHTVEQVSETLRYSDVSAFRKAFRNWTGMQPARYRDALAAH